MKRSIIPLAALLGASLAGAQENYGTWSSYRDITVNTKASGANVAATVAKYPLLVRLTAAHTDVFNGTSDGASLRFATIAGARLPYQIEQWDAVARTAAIWVATDSVRGNDSTASIRMFWGKAGAVDSSNGRAVFDTTRGFTGVWHLGENGGGVDKVKDATAHALHFTGHDSVPAVPGAIGNARWYNKAGRVAGDVSTYYIDSINTSPVMQSFGDSTYFTISVWVQRLEHFAQTQGIFGMYRYAAGNNRSIGLNYNTGNLIRVMTSPNGTTGTTGDRVTATTATFTVEANPGWTHIMATHTPSAATNGSVGRIYVNGVEQATSVTNPAASRSVFQATAEAARPLIGSQDTEGTSVQKFLGYIDEIQYSKGRTIASVRDSNWARLSYQTQRPTGGTAVLIGAATVVSTSAPTAPLNVGGASGNAQVTVSWSLPASNGSSNITLYKAMAVSDTNRSCTTNGSALTCVVTGLTNGTPYTFQVRATNAVGSSPLSAASAAVTPAVPPSVPGAPTGVTGTGGNLQVTVSWTAPASNGGSAITSYKAMAVSDTAKSCTANGSTLNCIVTGLASGTAYTFQVRAINVAGGGALSTASPSVTTGLRSSAFALRVDGIARPYGFRLSTAEMEATEALTVSIVDLRGHTVWSKTVNPSVERVREVSWDGRDASGRKASAGMYIVRLSLMAGGKAVRITDAAISLDPVK